MFSPQRSPPDQPKEWTPRSRAKHPTTMFHRMAELGDVPYGRYGRTPSQKCFHFFHLPNLRHGYSTRHPGSVLLELRDIFDLHSYLFLAVPLCACRLSRFTFCSIGSCLGSICQGLDLPIDPSYSDPQSVSTDIAQRLSTPQTRTSLSRPRIRLRAKLLMIWIERSLHGVKWSG